MPVRRFTVAPTTDSGGAATAYTPPVYGNLISVRYVKTDYAAGVDFVVTTEDTHRTLWSEEDVDASATRYPRDVTDSTAGVEADYASGGTAVNDRIEVSAERIKVVVAAGGSVKSGTFHFTLASGESVKSSIFDFMPFA